jgi:hypothetical protein
VGGWVGGRLGGYEKTYSQKVSSMLERQLHGFKY